MSVLNLVVSCALIANDKETCVFIHVYYKTASMLYTLYLKRQLLFLLNMFRLSINEVYTDS